MLSKTKLIELAGLGVAAAMTTTIPPLVAGSSIPPNQVAGAGVAICSLAAVAIVASKPKF
jgi:hypothetical protein